MNDFENKGAFRKWIVWLAILVLLIVFGFLMMDSWGKWGKIVKEEIDGMMTITGNFSCLPLQAELAREEGEECMLGIRGRDGLHYALDISRIQDANTDLKAEDNIAVTGVLHTGTTTQEWVDYDIVGVILVNTLLRTR